MIHQRRPAQQGRAPPKHNSMENRLWAVGHIEYRRMSDQKLEQEQTYVLHQINLTMQRIKVVSALLLIGKKTALTGSKLIQDLELHYRQLEAITDEKQFRIIV